MEEPSVVFYEKPGCINNRKQKHLLEQAGVRLDVRNLLEAQWKGPDLRAYFGDLPIPRWFNTTAPAIKSGAIDPQALTEDEAIRAMCQDPLLIRRPLLNVADQCHVGFDLDRVLADLGRAANSSIVVPDNIEQCPRSHAQNSSCESGGSEKKVGAE